ncbi:MAG TPA: LLM class flavin-dependent oxidoreductase [Hyphomicrobiaceae bacterium]|nr:LLM class flavin-dependent oxidoreductase [Hyphomicrobiaceae bacterium]
MKFGWLTLSHSPSPDDDAAAIDEQLEQACLAERLGFDSVWLTEHSFTGESVYCDPIPFASALAMKTERVRIGFAVIQMPLRHPVRLATQLSLLDNLCKGRLDVGIGRGTIFNEYEFVGYGLRSYDSRERMAEGLEIMLRAWTDTPLQYKGKYYDVSLPELRPRPYQLPHPPIWHSVVSPASFEDCGRRGVPIMTLRLPVPVLKERLALYECGLATTTLDKATQKELRRKAAVWRHVYVAESAAQAEDELSKALLEGRHHMNSARQAFNPPDFRIDKKFLNDWTNSNSSDADALKFTLASTVCGTPAQVHQQLVELKDIGVEHLLCQMSFGYLGHDRIQRSMHLFAEQVMPRLQGGEGRAAAK